VDAVHLVGVVGEERVLDAVRDRWTGLAQERDDKSRHREREGHAIPHLMLHRGLARQLQSPFWGRTSWIRCRAL
jgi:hypothetical protein